MIMKMKSFKLLNTIGIAAMTLLMTASCESGNKEFGYDGELYVCYDEFLDNEYLEEDYIKELLDNEKLYNKYLEDLKNK